MFIILGILLFFSISKYIIIFLSTLILIVQGLCLSLEYFLTKKKYTEYKNILEKLDKKYLIHEMIIPKTYEEKFFLEIVRSANSSMMDVINLYKDREEDYKDSIEAFVHEVKTPIAVINLIIDNNKNEQSIKLRVQNEKILSLVEEVLYMSKASNMENDYRIKEYSLEDIIGDTILENKFNLIENNVTLDIKDCHYKVYTDKKWLVFILNQLISNAIKYTGTKKKIEFVGKYIDGNVVLSVIDNGIGFDEFEDLNIYKKGYTGNDNEKSTGFGLYIVKNLSSKLNLKISIDYTYKYGGKFDLVFPKNDYYNLI